MLQLRNDSIGELRGCPGAAYVYRLDVRGSSVDDVHDRLGYPASEALLCCPCVLMTLMPCTNTHTQSEVKASSHTSTRLRVERTCQRSLEDCSA